MDARYYYLIYISQAIKSMSDADHFELVGQSYSYNKKHHITGILLYRVAGDSEQYAGRYMQLLEGYESDVRELFNKIKQDSRHQKITLVNEGYLSKKHFRNWTMAFKKVGYKEFSHPGYIDMEDVFQKKLTSSKFNVALMFLRTFYGMQPT